MQKVRKTILDPTHAFSGWTYSGGAYTSSPVTYGKDNLSTSSRADPFLLRWEWQRVVSNPHQRHRPGSGPERVGMDDRMGPNTRGDSLLRKIDFNYDHFVATYGPNGDGVGQTLLPVSTPQVSRRVRIDRRADHAVLKRPSKPAARFTASDPQLMSTVIVPRPEPTTRV